MRWGLLIAAALVMGVPVTAEAGPSQDLVIEGSRSAWTDVDFERPWHLEDFSAQISGGGRYAGVVVESLEGRPVRLLVALRAPGLSEPAISPTLEMREGRYRVRLLTDAPVRISFPLVEQEGRVIRPRRPLATALHVGRLELLAGRSVAQLRLPGAVPAGSSALVAAQVTGQRLEQSYACATTTASCPSLPVQPPAPVPPVEPGLRPPSDSNEPTVTRVLPHTATRAALVGVEGVRTRSGAITAAVVTYAP